MSCMILQKPVWLQLQEHCQCEVLRQAADAAAAWNASPWLNRLRSRSSAGPEEAQPQQTEEGTAP
jgi:hypothetical protein